MNSKVNNSNKLNPQKYFSGKVKGIFKNPNNDEYGQFIQFPPYPSNKDICTAKAILRDGIEMMEHKFNKKSKNLQWIVKQVTQDDNGNDIGIVGYRVEMV